MHTKHIYISIEWFKDESLEKKIGKTWESPYSLAIFSGHKLFKNSKRTSGPESLRTVIQGGGGFLNFVNMSLHFRYFLPFKTDVVFHLKYPEFPFPNDTFLQQTS